MTVAGVTIDSTSGIARIIAGLQSMPRRLTTRVVFDENVAASYYTTALGQLNPVTDVMGELLDSAYVKAITTSNYIARARSYLAAHAGTVKIWEVGNEVNGNWLGAYSDVAAKIDGAFGVFNDAGKTTALTLYYNPNNVDGAKELTPVTFSQQFVSPRMKAGLDYVLLSFYETQFNNYRPSVAVVTALCEQLHGLYPNAQIGFGEIGLPRRATATTLAKAKSIMAYYYQLRVALPYYCGGYFWWYGAEDVFGKTALLTDEFKSAVASMP